MCLFTELSDPCNHAECRLIQTVRDLNQDVFLRANQESNRVVIPSLSSIANSDRANIPRPPQIPQRSGSQHIISQSDIPQNPQMSQPNTQMILKLRDEVTRLTRLVNNIMGALQDNGIHVQV